MHIGNLRIAIFNYILSKQLNRDLIIRIEDTDTKRNIEGKDKRILEILDLFGISYSRVVIQSENIKFHRQIAMKLLIEQKAFNCFCTSDDLEASKLKAKEQKRPYRYDGGCDRLEDNEVIDNERPFKVRLKKPEKPIKFKDNLKGEFEFAPFDIDSFVILREDKTPTYNFACGADDMLLDISYIIRGEDHLSNTPKQIHIRNQLNYDKEIQYLHLPMILNAETGKKMSKRDDGSSVDWLLDEGFLPVAIANYLVLIGNKLPKDKDEIFDIDEAIEWFDVKNISKSPAKFDMTKLRFINNKHLAKLDDMRLSKLLGYADSDIGKLAKIYLEEASTLKELKSKVDLYFGSKDSLDGFEEELETLKSYFKEADFIDDFNELKKAITAQTGLKGKKLFMPLRYILTGSSNGPNLSDVYPLIKNYLGEIVK
jgi:glutamyl-tRNA synthetase